jgi:hypothetical protein
MKNKKETQKIKGQGSKDEAQESGSAGGEEV